jgi:hypothetical protein
LDEIIAAEGLNEFGEPENNKTSRKHKHTSRRNTAKGVEAYSSDPNDDNFDASSSVSESDSDDDVVILNEEVSH